MLVYMEGKPIDSRSQGQLHRRGCGMQKVTTETEYIPWQREQVKKTGQKCRVMSKNG